MKRIRRSSHIALIALLSLVVIADNPSTSIATDESAEPPLRFSVKVGDKTATISEGETIELEGTFTDPKITITPLPYRVFSYQGLTLSYPRSFTFEADIADPNAKIWTLSGNDFKIMYFVLNAPLTIAEYAENMIDEFGRENAEVVNANANILLGGQKLSGTSLRVAVVSHQMVMDIYRLPSRGGRTKLLVFQDSVDDSDNRSQEGKQTLTMINSSFGVER